MARKSTKKKRPARKPATRSAVTRPGPPIPRSRRETKSERADLARQQPTPTRKLRGGRGQVLDVERALDLLSRATTVEEVKEVHDVAKAAKTYLRQRGAGQKAVIGAAEVVVRSEIQLGAFLASSPKVKAGRPPRNGADRAPISPLAELGIEKKDSSRWQKAAGCATETVDAYLSHLRARLNEIPSTSTVVALAKLTDGEQEEVVDRVVAGEALTFTKALGQIRQEKRMARFRGLAVPPGFDTLGRHPIVYADPPWRFDDQPPRGAATNHYPDLAADDVAAIKVAEISTDDALCYLWVPNPLLLDGLRVLEAWSFRYVGNFAWDKGAIGTGYWARSEHELLLIGVRGNPPKPAPENRSGTMIREKRTEHSAKPLAAYDVIERAYPGVPKVELFARARRPGWTSWGNELGAEPVEQPGNGASSTPEQPAAAETA